MLFARELLDQGCRFDENFDIFEDWDFWLQLSQHTDFHHIDKCTAFYRSGGTSQTAELEDHLQRFDPAHPLGKARAAVYDKWLRRWGGGQLNRLLGVGQREMAESVKRIGELGREQERLARMRQKAKQKAVEAEQKAIEAERKAVEADNVRVRMEARLNAAIGELQAENVHLHDAVQDLRSNLEAVFNSRSWRLTRPYRALGEMLKSKAGGGRLHTNLHTNLHSRNKGFRGIRSQSSGFSAWQFRTTGQFPRHQGES